jgi:hypothetical protein
MPCLRLFRAMLIFRCVYNGQSLRRGLRLGSPKPLEFGRSLPPSRPRSDQARAGDPNQLLYVEFCGLSRLDR